jgi:hypothetical protein
MAFQFPLPLGGDRRPRRRSDGGSANLCGERKRRLNSEEDSRVKRAVTTRANDQDQWIRPRQNDDCGRSWVR